MLTGSIDARGATLVHEWTVSDLGELEKSWAALGKIEAYKRSGKETEPSVGSGSACWEDYRLL